MSERIYIYQLFSQQKMKLSHGHKSILNRLSKGGRTSKSFTNMDTVTSQLSIHFVRYLDDMQRLGLVVEINDQWHLTQSGREAIHDSREKVKCPSWVGKGIYEGEELKSRVARRGAYDFLKYPSRMGDLRVFVK